MANHNSTISLTATVPADAAGTRVDALASQLFPDYSRARLQNWIKAGSLTIDGAACKPRDKCYGGETLALNAEPEPAGDWQPEAISLDICYEDESLLVLNKPAGLVVHPGAGNPSGTLLNALLHHCPALAEVPRAGIVHRLDKDTTGLMVVAKTPQAQLRLVRQLQKRTVKREYDALVVGQLIAGGTVDQPIARHPSQRTKMAVSDKGGKEAVTHYTLVRCQLETGRTHQIRVHMAWLKHPLVGDKTYGASRQLAAGISSELRDCISRFPRQALHATRLELIHPEHQQSMAWHAPRPADFEQLLSQLQQEDPLV